MAKTPLRFLPIGQFLGDVESAEPISLPASLSSGGSKNLTIDKLARATSILGYSRVNASPVTSNTGAVALRLRNLYHYILRDSVTGAITRQELGIFDDGNNVHFELRKSTDGGASWTFVSDLGVGFQDVIPDFAQQGNALSICTGGAVQSWDGTTLAAASSSRLAAPTIADAGAGQISGTPRWRVVPIKSDGTRKAGSVVSALTPLANRKATVTWVADADGTVVGYEVYRTTGTGGVASGAGIQGLFFFAGSSAARLTVTFTDNLSDLDLISGRVLQEHGDSPPSGAKYCEIHSERTLYGNLLLSPRRWYWSDPGLPYSVNQDSSFFDMTDAESFSDESTGGTGNFQNMFVAWLERSIWTISGDGTYNGSVINLARRRTNARTGTVHHRTVARIPAGAKYIDETGAKKETTTVTLAYLTPLRDVRLFDGQNDTIISAAKTDTFATLTYASRRKCYVIQDTARGEATWVFPASDNTEPSYAVTWNYRYGVWYDRPGWASLACAEEIESSTEALVLLAGEASLTIGGRCYQLWDGYTLGDGATAVNAQVMTGTLYGSVNYYDRGLTDVTLVSWQKRWRWIELLVKANGGPLTLLIEWLPTEVANDATAYGSVSVTLPTSNLETSDLSLLTTVDGSQLTVPVVAPPAVIRVNLKADVKGSRYLHSRGIRFRISSTTSGVQWSVVGANVAYQLLGARRLWRR